MEKAGTKLGSEILCVDSYLGIQSIIKNSQKIGSELKAVTELAGEFDKFMMEGTCCGVSYFFSPSTPGPKKAEILHNQIVGAVCVQ